MNRDKENTYDKGTMRDYPDGIILPEGDVNQTYPEGRIDYNPGTDVYENKPLENEVYNNIESPGNEIYPSENEINDTVSPSSGDPTSPETDIIEDTDASLDPVSHAGGLFYPLFNQAKNFLASVGFILR